MAMYVWLCMYGYACMAMHVWLCMYGYVCMAMYVWLCMHGYVCIDCRINLTDQLYKLKRIKYGSKTKKKDKHSYFQWQG